MERFELFAGVKGKKLASYGIVECENEQEAYRKAFDKAYSIFVTMGPELGFPTWNTALDEASEGYKFQGFDLADRRIHNEIIMEASCIFESYPLDYVDYTIKKVEE